jgi:hypothetical protein
VKKGIAVLKVVRGTAVLQAYLSPVGSVSAKRRVRGTHK